MPPHPIYVGMALASGYDMGVNTSGGRTDWVADMNGYMRMAYPSGQDWGAVFITFGEPKDPPRPGQDLSHCRTLSVELRGEAGGEQVWIGLKDNTDLDDGNETKIWVPNLTREWRTYLFPLSDFDTADVKRLYVVIEFVFEPGTPAETVDFRNVRYLPTPAPEPPTTVALTPTEIGPHAVYVGTALTSGYDMGVDTSGGRTDWVTDRHGYMRMAYPGDQDWGAVFITVGEPTDPPRPGQDLSHYQTLSLELRGEVGGEQVWIGLKDNTDPDDGGETKIWVPNLTKEWRTYLFSLSDFDTADVERLYVVIEFVFEPGTPAETVYFRNVQYLSTTASQLTATVTRTPTPTATPTPTSTGESVHAIYVGTGLASGYDMGVDTSSGRSDWVTNMGGYMRMAYPGDQDWGAVFITVGEPTDPPRPGQDLSHYQTLSLELRGEVGGEQVWIGLKDNTDPDDGNETKIWVHSLSREWQSYQFPLSAFRTADLERLYVVIEFVFESGTPEETVYFRNVDYLATPAPDPTATVAPTPTPTPAVVSPHPVYMGTTLARGYDMGVNTSGGRTDWVTDMHGYMRMAYPDNQAWGAVFITVGRPTDPPRPSRNLSQYQTLSLELRGEVGWEQVWIGLKDDTDPDSGQETKVLVYNLTTEWQTYTFPLSYFSTADLARLYVVTEFVFEPGTPAETVYFRNIQYLP